MKEPNLKRLRNSRIKKGQFSSVQFSRSVVCDSLPPHELQHARPPCPSPTPGVHSDSYPASQWCHPAISSSVIPFSSSPYPFQHQSLFQWVSSSNEVAKVLEFQLYHQSFLFINLYKHILVFKQFFSLTKEIKDLRCFWRKLKIKRSGKYPVFIDWKNS